MKGKLIAACVLALVTIPVLSATAIEKEAINVNSNTPLITGPTEGILGEIYDYKITYTDSNGDDVYYKIIWGDCTVVCNAGPFKSGEEVTFSHAWCSICTGPGKFTIRVQASDNNGQDSNWGTLEVTMKSNRKSISHNLLLMHLFERLIERFPILENLLDL
jgi:hypothetical protein